MLARKHDVRIWPTSIANSCHLCYKLRRRLGPSRRHRYKSRGIDESETLMRHHISYPAAPYGPGHCATQLAIAAAVFLLAATLPAQAAERPPAGLPGDVNLDGRLDLLDVQKAINQTIEAASPTPEADLNRDGAVNIFDVQVLIRSALGKGGLIQPLRLTVEKPSGTVDWAKLRAVALSSDGLRVEAALKATGGGHAEAQFGLWTGRAWRLAVFDIDEGKVLALARFRVCGKRANMLPLTGPCNGRVLNMGALVLGKGTPTLLGPDACTISAQMVPDASLSDGNGNGIPEYLDAWMAPVVDFAAAFADSHGPDSLKRGGFERHVAAAIAEAGGLQAPSPADFDADGLPDSLQTAMGSIQTGLLRWLKEGGFRLGAHPVPDDNANGLPDPFEPTLAALRKSNPEAIANLSVPQLTDINSNGVADFFEPMLLLRGGIWPGFTALALNGEGEAIARREGEWDPLAAAKTALPGLPWQLDQDEDGLPDVADDDDDNDGWPDPFSDPDGNGRPLLLDRATAPVWDTDGDGLCDVLDADDDGDGLPDYADPQPLNLSFDAWFSEEPLTLGPVPVAFWADPIR